MNSPPLADIISTVAMLTASLVASLGALVTTYVWLSKRNLSSPAMVLPMLLLAGVILVLSSVSLQIYLYRRLDLHSSGRRQEHLRPPCDTRSRRRHGNTGLRHLKRRYQD